MSGAAMVSDVRTLEQVQVLRASPVFRSPEGVRRCTSRRRKCEPVYTECLLGGTVGARLGAAAGFTAAHLAPKRAIVALWPDHQPAPFLSLCRPYSVVPLGPVQLYRPCLCEKRGRRLGDIIMQKIILHL